MKFGKIFGFILMFILLIGLSSAYIISYPKLTTGGAFNPGFQSDNFDVGFDESLCQQGQDFIVQIDPLGCSPTIVRSDLLEEQDVPVFCKLQAIKINPIIDIEAIRTLKIYGEYSPEVRTVGFYPSKSALGENQRLNNLMWDDIGYALIYLRQQPNESAMPNFVEGNLTAKIMYDLNDAFGIRYHNFYLPVMTDSEFERKMGQYAFFDKRGYLRAEDVTDNSASIVVYSGVYESPFGKSRQGEINKQKIGGYNLGEGQSTNTIYLPGFGCYAGVQFKLDGIKISNTRAKLSVNSEIFEVEKGEKFLDNACSVSSIEKSGINEKIRLNCKTDDGSTTFELNMNPSVKLKIDNEVKDVLVGDYLYTIEEGSEKGKDVYLAYVDTIDQSDDEDKLEIFLVSMSDKLESKKLDDNDILAAAYLARGYSKVQDGGSVVNYIGAASVNFAKWIAEGKSFMRISYDPSVNFGGKVVEIVGFGDEENYPLPQNIEENYNLALDEYDLILSNFRQEKYPEDDLVTTSEKAAFDKIYLANSLNQKQDMQFFCDDFEELFADSEKDVSICDEVKQGSNREVSSRDILVNGKYKRIDLQTIIQPKYEEYGAKIFVGGLEKGSQSFDIGKDQIIYLDGGDYIKLDSLGEDFAVLELSIKDVDNLGKIKKTLISSKETLNLNKVNNFGSKYSFTLAKVNLEKVAKVSVHPSVSYTGSEAEFSFKVGIEKRAIQLSPEKTKERIGKLNEAIETFTKISSGLDNVVSGLKTACLGTGAILTAKNLIAGANGKTIAREQVMRGESGWYQECADLDYLGTKYSSVDDCLLKNANLIDKEVDEITRAMTASNSKIKKDQEEFIDKGKLLEQDSLRVDEFTVSVAENLNTNLKSLEGENLTKGKINVNLTNVLNVLDKNGFENDMYDLEDLKELELYNNLYAQTKNPIYKDRLITAMNQIEVNSENYLEYSEAKEKANRIEGLEGMSPQIVSNEKAMKEVYQGFTSPTNPNHGDIPGKTPIQSIIYNHKYYYVTLNETALGSNKFYINELYDEFGILVQDSSRIKDSYSYFVKYEADSYKNSYLSVPKVRYYETDPYKGMPAVVPFDKEDGWYVYVKQTIPAVGNIRSYDESGRINSFYLCNIGDNRIEDYSEGRESDDICQMINVQTSQPYNVFNGLSPSETSKKIKEAVNAVEQATRAYKSGVKRVTIGKRDFDVGSPAINTLSTQCQDVMSPKDCQILFNVCDPVICPPSRCDFGGAYPVQDVIQSGIIGSVALCLPNFNEGIYVPVCLTGVKAGLDGLISVTSSYRDCLDHSLKTGETVGVCDEINSIYMCEFFWRQALPLTQVIVPKLIGLVSGQNVKGGGEYLGLHAAFENAKDSIDFFTQSYALNSFNAFKARSQEDVGSAVCKNFVSISYPQGQGFLDALTESDSPPQYSGNFDAIPFTTATNPPIDHYKVYYHIYAGNDRGAYYKVYLRGGGSSYYGDTFSGRTVASGYIASGDYESQTVDFTAPSGYKEMCIVVNNDEKCGFKEVTTSFAKNYVKDQYLQEQINNTDINSEKECISGTTSLYSLLNPNVQGGAEDLIDPAIYNRGIIRICATDNPGKGSDDLYGGEDQRWIQVGTCGDKNIKCWIDTRSIDSALEFETSVNESLDSLAQRLLKQFEEAEGALNSEQFKSNVSFIEKEGSAVKRLELIKGIFDKVYRNNQKAHLIFLKGGALGDIAKGLFDKLPKVSKVTPANIVDIYDLVNDENFVSPVLFLSGYSKNNIFVQFDKGKWNYQIISRDVSFDYMLSEIQKFESGSKSFSNQIIVENEFIESFLKNLNEKDYPEGVNYILKLLGDKNKKVYGIEQIILESAKISIDEKKNFEVQLGKTREKFYLSFVKNEWKWSMEGSFDYKYWKNMEDDSMIYTSFLNQIKNLPTDVINLFKKEDLDRDENEFIFPEEYSYLKDLLEDKEELEGDLILLGGSENWNLLEKTLFLLTASEALTQLNELEDYYNDNYEVSGVLMIVESFFIDLMNEGLIDFVPMEDLMGPAKKNPRFDLVRAELEGTSSNVESNSDLIEAAYNGDLDKVKELIEGGANIESKGYAEKTSLMWASEKGHLEVVKYLVENGANVNSKDYHGHTVLMWGYQEGHLEVVKYVVENGAEVNAVRKDGMTALMGTSILGLLEETKYLVEQGANIDVKDNDGKTALDYANEFNRIEVINYLKSKGAVNGESVSEEIFLKKGSISFFKGAWIYYTYDSEWKWTPDKINWMKSSQMKVIGGEHNGESPIKMHLKIIEALEGKNFEEGKKILKEEGATMEDGSTISLIEEQIDLIEAAWYGDLTKVKTLIESGVEINSQLLAGGGSVRDGPVGTALMSASSKGHLDVVKYLVANGADVNAKSEGRWTALILASFEGHLDVVKYLIENGAELNVKNVAGGTALDYAEYYGHTDIANYLKSKGAKSQSEIDEEICEPIAVSQAVEQLSDAREKVLKAAEELEGKFAYIGDSGCFDAAVFVYESANTYYSCIYSDSLGRDYEKVGVSIDGKIFQVATTPKDSCNNNLGGENLGESIKLSKLQPGDLISFVYTKNSGHNAIFIRWVDYANRKALLFDWNGENYNFGEENFEGQICEGKYLKDKRYCKTYQYVVKILSDSEHPVYMYWTPVIKGENLKIESGNVVTQKIEDKEPYYDYAKAKVDAANFKLSTYETDEKFSGFVDALYRDEILNKWEYYLFKFRLLNSASLKKRIDELNINGKHLVLDKISLIADFDKQSERDILNSASSCESCGSGWNNFCDERECFALEMLNGNVCDFSKNRLGVGSCITK